MDERYVVVSTRHQAHATAKGIKKKPGLIPAGASAKGDITSAPDSAPRMVVDIVDRAAVAERKRQPGFEAGAPSMPMSLITPFASAAAAAGPIMWGVRAVRADTSPFDGSNVTIAVLDTGIDRTHPAFAGVDILERDFTGDGNGDQNGHGTHCAGTIFGREVSGMRIGIARGITRALIGKVLGRTGGASEHIVSALQWAIDEGANVISMSLGIDFPGYQVRLQRRGLRPEAATSLALEGYRLNVQLFDRIANVIETLAAFRQPCLLIAATGNESGRGDNPPFEIDASPPAVSVGFIAVGALQQGAAGLEVAPFSNSGSAVCGPGVDIVSARAGGGLVALSGTSMAAPHVAGVAALWAQKLASAGSLAVRPLTTQLLSSGTKTGLAAGFSDDAVGAGIVTAPQ